VILTRNPLPLAWQQTALNFDGATKPALGASATEAEAALIYCRAAVLGRFRFGWSEKQTAFLKNESGQWTAATCLGLGDSILGNQDSCLWELAPLEQAALCRLRSEHISDLHDQAGLSSRLRESFALMRSREEKQQQEYEQLALAVQHVTQAKEREINNPWFLDALQTQAAGRLPIETLRSGLLVLAHILAEKPDSTVAGPPASPEP
jgi:hypothetical protein